MDKEQALEAYRQKEASRMRAGRIIVAVIAVPNLLAAVLQAIAQFHLVVLLINIALSVALFCGVSWVRYLFAAFSALDVVAVLYFLLVGADFSDSPYGGLVIGILLVRVAYDVTASVLLFASRSVSEFLYSQKNG